VTDHGGADLFLAVGADPTAGMAIVDAVAATPEPSLDLQVPLGVVDLDGAAAKVAVTDSADLWLRATVLIASELAGNASATAAQSVEYAKDREQFGKPIGAFQALSHYMADAAPVVEGAKTLVYEAAWAHSTGRDIKRLAPMAKLFACKAFRDVTSMAEQVHGGIGFTLDYDIQLYYRRAKQLQLNWWDSRYLEGLIAADVLDRGLPRTIPDPFTV
jgi:hypothetical protein